MWLNYRINKVDKKVELMGGLIFAVLDGLALENEAIKKLIIIIDDILKAELKDEEQVKEAEDFLAGVSKDLDNLPTVSEKEKAKSTAKI